MFSLLNQLRDLWNTVRNVCSLPLLAPAGSEVSGERLTRFYRFNLPVRFPVYGLAIAGLTFAARLRQPGVPFPWPPVVLFAVCLLPLLWRRALVLDRAAGTLAVEHRLVGRLTVRGLPLADVAAVTFATSDEAVPDLLVDHEVTNFRVSLRLASESPVWVLTTTDVERARGEAVLLSLAMRKPLADRLAGTERLLSPEDLARSWSENVILGALPLPDGPDVHPTLAERATADGPELLHRYGRCGYGNKFLLFAATGAAAWSTFAAFASDRLDLAMVATFVLALLLFHALKSATGALVFQLGPEALTVAERFVFDRPLLSIRWERLRDVAAKGGREPRLYLIAASGVTALGMPEQAAQAVARRLYLHVKELVVQSASAGAPPLDPGQGCDTLGNPQINTNPGIQGSWPFRASCATSEGALDALIPSHQARGGGVEGRSPSQTQALLAISLATFFWAISFIASKVALATAPPLTVVFLRLAIAALCFWLLLAWRGIRLGEAARKVGYGPLFALSLAGTSLHYGTQTWGLQYSSAIKSSLYVTTGPVAILLLGWLFLGERITARKSAGILIAIAGALTLLGWSTLADLTFRDELFGDLLVLASILLWGIFTVLGKFHGKSADAPTLTGLVTMIGAATMLPLSLGELQMRGLSFGTIAPAGWLAIAFLGLTCSFLATWLYFAALERMESQKVGAFLYLIPPQTALISVLFLAEPVTKSLVVGALLVLAGVWLAERG